MTWIERDGGLHREIRTKDFVSAFALAQALVEPSERLNHHPDVEFGWGYLRIHLTTHDAGGVTAKDHQLARLIDEVLAPFCA
jgi:4a-hydroxytetrahydrobiopterin dehydratase